MAIELTETDIGRKVIYVPNHANDDAGHPDCEEGVITSINDTAVFVRYGSDYGSKGTDRDNLIWVNPKV
jgi:hypothetical protein